MAGTYKNYMKLLESWPIDKSKPGRDLGHYIRERIKLEFSSHKVRTPAEKQQCDRYYNSLQTISSDHYMKLYPRKLSSSGTGLTYEQCNFALKPEVLEHFQGEQRSFFQKLADKFKPKNDDTDKKISVE